MVALVAIVNKLNMADPKIKIKFANPNYNTSTKKFKFDVQYLSDTPNVRLFGHNVRFIYDGSMFENANSNTVKFTDFVPGYGTFSPYPNYMTNPTFGKAYFNLTSTIAPYINSAIAMNNVNATPVIISTDPNNWTKLFTVELTTKTVLSGEVYPILIWDQEEVSQNGGFIPNNDGNKITHVVDPSGIIRTGPTKTTAEHFNWEQTPGSVTLPWGNPTTKNKVNI